MLMQIIHKELSDMHVSYCVFDSIVCIAHVIMMFDRIGGHNDGIAGPSLCYTCSSRSHAVLNIIISASSSQHCDHDMDRITAIL